MKDMLLRMWRAPKVRWGGALFLAMVLFGFVAPLLLHHGPMESVGGLYDTPSAKCWLGTDNFGRDVFTQLAYGTRTSLDVGLLSGLVATLIGTVFGAVAGYEGGIIDGLLNSITNLFIVIPPFVVLILLSISVGTRSVFMLAVVIGVTSWSWVSRSVRAQVLTLKTRQHVDVARINGYGRAAIITLEILPYVLSYLVMAFVLQVAGGILNEATLSMLGLGPDNTVSLGTMLNWALMYESLRTGEWWAFVPPVAAIALITFSLKYVNSGMDEVFNPRLRQG